LTDWFASWMGGCCDTKRSGRGNSWTAKNAAATNYASSTVPLTSWRPWCEGNQRISRQTLRSKYTPAV